MMREFLKEHKGVAWTLIALIVLMAGLLSLGIWADYVNRQRMENLDCMHQLYGIECEDGFVTYTPQSQ